jgi:hypothetical protein
MNSTRNLALIFSSVKSHRRILNKERNIIWFAFLRYKSEQCCLKLQCHLCVNKESEGKKIQQWWECSSVIVTCLGCTKSYLIIHQKKFYPKSQSHLFPEPVCYTSSPNPNLDVRLVFLLKTHTTSCVYTRDLCPCGTYWYHSCHWPDQFAHPHHPHVVLKQGREWILGNTIQFVTQESLGRMLRASRGTPLNKGPQRWVDWQCRGTDSSSVVRLRECL